MLGPNPTVLLSNPGKGLQVGKPSAWSHTCFPGAGLRTPGPGTGFASLAYIVPDLK